MEAFEYLLGKPHEEPHLMNSEIISIYKTIKNSIKQLEDVESKQQNKQITKYLITFSKIMEKMSHDVARAKQRYENIDKQGLIDDRLIQIATSIKLFRSQAQKLNSQISIVQKDLKEVITNNECMYVHNQQLKKALRRKQLQKERHKSMFITQQNSQKDESNTRNNNISTSKYSNELLPADQQCKTFSSFYNYRYNQTKISTSSKRSHFQSTKITKIWNYSTKMTNLNDQ